MSLSIVLHPSGYKKEGAQPEIFTNLWSREQYVPKNRRSIYAEEEDPYEENKLCCANAGVFCDITRMRSYECANHAANYRSCD